MENRISERRKWVPMGFVEDMEEGCEIVTTPDRNKDAWAFEIADNTRKILFLMLVRGNTAVNELKKSGKL